ncbi:unnamed protein product [Lota lota]
MKDFLPGRLSCELIPSADSVLQLAERNQELCLIHRYGPFPAITHLFVPQAAVEIGEGLSSVGRSSAKPSVSSAWK